MCHVDPQRVLFLKAMRIKGHGTALLTDDDDGERGKENQWLIIWVLSQAFTLFLS